MPLDMTFGDTVAKFHCFVMISVPVEIADLPGDVGIALASSLTLRDCDFWGHKERTPTQAKASVGSSRSSAMVICDLQLALR